MDPPVLTELADKKIHETYTWKECKSSMFTWDVPVFWACALLLAARSKGV